MISCVIPHFYNKQRGGNLQLIIDSLVGVDEVIIWNNDKEDGFPNLTAANPAQHLTIVQSGENIGCQGRFAGVKHLGQDIGGEPPTHVLFHDNDILTHPGSVARLLRASQSYPDQIITISGHWRGQVYISRGQFELIPWVTLERLLLGWKPQALCEHDDMWLSVRAHKLGIQKHVMKVRWKNLWDDVGFWRQPNWPEIRQAAFQRLMEEL